MSTQVLEGGGEIANMMGTLTPPRQHRPLPLRVLRALLRRWIRGVVLLVYTLWAHRVSTALVLVLAGLLAFSWSNQAGSSPAGATLVPAAAVQSYFDARANFDAPAMWDLMGEEYRSNYGTVQGLQQWLERIRRQGTRFLDSKYIAGYALSDGRQVYLYIASVEQGDRVQEIPYTFTVNQAGKIVRID